MTPINRFWIVVRIGILGCGAVAVTRDAEATNFPLVCTGNMNSFFVQADSDGIRTTITFGKAISGANAAPPSPGTCAWRDRPLRTTEPTCITVTNGKAPNIFENARFNGTSGTSCSGLDPSSVECGMVRAGTAAQQVTFSITPTRASDGCFTAASSS